MLKRKMVSVLLAVAMVMGLSVPAFAAENEKAAAERAAAAEAEYLELLAMDEDNLSPEIIKKYYTMTEEEAAAIRAENNDDAASTQMASAPTENINVAIRRMAAQATAIAGPYSAICSMPAKDLEIMLENMESGGVNSEIYAQNYNGQMCYLFSDGTKNVYVKASAFYTTAENGKTFPADSTVSYNLTSYINQQDTDSICSTHVSCNTSDNSVYYWKVAQIGTQAFAYSDANDVVRSDIMYSVHFSATPHCVTVYSPNSSILYQPELTLKMTSGGSNNAYFGGFKLEGIGEKIGTSVGTFDISKLLDLGYNSALLFSGNYSFATFYGIWSKAFNIYRDTCGSQFFYHCTKTDLSNPKGHHWVRQCSMKAPYKLTLKGNSFVMDVGICQYNSTIKYAVTVQYNF